MWMAITWNFSLVREVVGEDWKRGGGGGGGGERPGRERNYKTATYFTCEIYVKQKYAHYISLYFTWDWTNRQLQSISGLNWQCKPNFNIIAVKV